MKLNCWGSVEEQELRFIQIEGSFGGLVEVVEIFFDLTGFLCSGRVHEHGIIHKLVVGRSKLYPMKMEALKRAINNGGFDVTT